MIFSAVLVRKVDREFLLRPQRVDSIDANSDGIDRNECASAALDRLHEGGAMKPASVLAKACNRGQQPLLQPR